MEAPSFPAAALQTVRAAPGSAASLCLPLPAGTSPFLYTWSRAGASLDDRFTTSDDAGGVRLTVSTAQTGDSGVYTLQASNAAGSDTTKVRLEVSADEAPTGEDPPTFLRRLQDLTVKVGTRTRFLVEILSSTECKVTWYRNERRLMEAERVSLARDGNFWCADVAAVSVDDAGRWTCTAENDGGRASCSAHLNVLVPKAYKRPEFVEELRALLTEQGTVSLECKVVGVPTPVLRWFKDSREIKAGDVFALTANAEDPTSLGTYTCEAVNCMGRAYSSSKVHVVGHGSGEGSARPSSSGVIPEPPPIFTKELEDQAVRICESVTLSCQLVVPPWPRSVVWYNKEGKVEPGERYHVMEDGVGGYLLEVVSAEWQDEGEWKCVATSSGGRVGISTCFVTMDVPKNYRKPRFMENLQAVLTEEGLVSFECKVVGFPTPVLSWFKDGQELKPGDVYQLTGTNSLGSYCCIARNCMGQASSSAELTVEDIQNQLNEEEKLQLFSRNQAPKFIQGLKSVEVKIDEPFRFTIKVSIPPEPSVLWYRDDQPVDESSRCHHRKEERGVFYLDIQNLELLDQAEWKCVAINDFGHSVTSCFLKLIIPRHYKKPRFLENLQAILSEEGAVNLECKVIGVPQPVLKWYKDGEELKPGDIHRIISGQDGTCCLGTYTCEAQNCMGIAASSASLLGFDDSMKAKKKKTEEQTLQRNLSLSTIHEERTSQMYDTPVGDITEDKGEISFSFDGKEVSVSLYETPDLTEEEALQIVEMYADQLSENVTEHNVVELPPLRFVKETSTSGNLLMEAIIIDVSPEYFPSHEEDLRTEADVDDISNAEENGPPNLSLDKDVDIVGEDYLEKTMALLSEEKANKFPRKKSDSQKSIDDFFSLSRDNSLSEEKRDEDTQVISESDLQSFASAKSLEKPKSKSPKPSGEDGQESSEPTKTILFKDDLKRTDDDSKSRKERRRSRSRRSSSGSERCHSKPKEEPVKTQEDAAKSLIPKNASIEGDNKVTIVQDERVNVLQELVEINQEKLIVKSTDREIEAKVPQITSEQFKDTMSSVSESLFKVINDIQMIEKGIILKSELMSSAATASKSLEIISSIIAPLSEIHSITDAAKESAEVKELTSSLFNSLPQPLKALQQSLTIIEKCIDVESDNKTLVKKTCVAFIKNCGEEIQKLISEINSVTTKNYLFLEPKVLKEIETVTYETNAVIKFSTDTIRTKQLLNEANAIKEDTVETKHLKETQRTVFELKGALNSLLNIVERAETGKIEVISKVKTTDVILDNMSVAIHDLQTALERIESLSVKESNSLLPNYNTEIIENVMDSVLKLRCLFEELSIESTQHEDKTLLKETLGSIKMNLKQIESHINRIENNIGTFDILQNENKLDILQKMAQILIALENNLPRLEIIPEVKIHMNAFHKNITKILESVIESNEAIKYSNLMEICNAVNIMNSSIKDINSDNILSLASISNTLRIVEDKCINNIFESELNCSLLTNITDILIGIQKAINKAEDVSLCFDSDHVQEIPDAVYDISKSRIIVEHIDKTIAAINIVKSLESASQFKETFVPVLENINPILEELKKNIACATGVAAQDENLSNILSLSLAETLANPLYELNQNIFVLSQVINENTESIKDNNEMLVTFAEPLHELHKTLEILQQDVFSQYGEELTPYEVSVNMASAVNHLESCIIMVQEQAGVEGADEMSTLEDISGIKTSADIIVADRLFVPTGEVTIPELRVYEFETERPKSAAADALQTLNEHLTVLQNPEIIEALETLSEISEFSSLKSVVLGLGELHTGIEEIIHPVLLDKSDDILNLVNTSKLLAIAEPMQELQQNLSVLETDNISIYENVLEISPDKMHKILETVSNFKEHLGRCMRAMFPALETAENTIEISNKVGILREVCEHLKNIMESTEIIKSNDQGCLKMKGLRKSVHDLLVATDVSKGIRIEQVKCITEELYEQILNVQEDLIQFTSQSPEKLAQEVRLIEIIHEVETNIAILEQYDFIDLSKASELTSCVSSQVAVELESSSLLHMDDIVENAVNVVQDSIQETPLADLLIIEDFFKTCKNEFAILRCLAPKVSSYKKIIRLLQEFDCLQNTINEFKVKRYDLKLTDDINTCLTTFFVHADECLKNVQTSLVHIVESQSDLLFQAPLSKIEASTSILNEIITKETDINEVLVQFTEILNIAKPCIKSAKIDIIAELNGSHSEREKSKGKMLSDKIEAFITLIENKMKASNTDKKAKLKKVLQCIERHSDYRDATGTGQVMIILKCLTECTDLMHDELSSAEFKKQVPIKGKIESELKTVLIEMLEPLQALHSQVKNIQEQVLSGAEEESISVDVTTTKSLVNAMTEIHKEIVDKIDVLSVDSEEVSLVFEVDKEIQSIQDDLQAVDNVEVVQSVRELVKPLEEVEKTVKSILTTQKSSAAGKGELTRDINANIGSLEQAIESFISLEFILPFSEFIVNFDMYKCIKMAKEMKCLLLLSKEISSEIKANKIKKMSSLKEMLLKFDWVNTEKTLEGKNGNEVDILKHIFLITYQLVAELEKEICQIKHEQEKATQLFQHIDQYIELIEIVEEISAVIKIEDLKKSVDIAKELRESLVFETEIEIPETLNIQISAQQTRLANKLQIAISALQVQAIDSAQELAPELYSEVLQRITKVTEQLQADLIAVTGLHVAVQAPLICVEGIKSELLSDSAIFNTETLEVECTEMNAIEQVAESQNIVKNEAIAKTDSSEKYSVDSTELESSANIMNVKGEKVIEALDIKDETMLNIQGKVIVNEDLVPFKDTLDINTNVKEVKTLESLEIKEKSNVNIESIEVISKEKIPLEQASELTEDLSQSHTRIKSEAGVAEIVKIEAKETVNLEEVIIEQAVDMKSDVAKAQAIESREIREEGQSKIESKEIIREVEKPDEIAPELKKELLASKADVKTETSVTEIMKIEAKETVSSEKVITEQAVDMKCEVAKAQAIVSRETREEGRGVVESKEIIRENEIADEKALELKEELLPSKDYVKSETAENEIVKIEGKETVISEEVITEQAVDMKGEAAKVQAIESYETREEGRGIVESKEIIREVELPDDKASELKEELLTPKADVKSETTETEIVNLEAKETMSSEEVITEQAVDMKGDVGKAQAIESCETREEGRSIVESKEVIREVEMPDDKASELKEELQASKADIKTATGVTEIVNQEAKETVSSDEVITEQAVDMKCEIAKVQAIESCETREEGQVKVESKEIIREVAIPDEKSSELKEEILTPKADVKSETGEPEIVKIEAKETVSSEEVITEQVVDMKGHVGKAEAIESCETREEGRGVVESKEVIREVVMPDDKASELKEELLASKADIKTATGVTEIVNHEAKETVNSEKIITAQAVDIKGDVAKAQAIESREIREEGQGTMESKEIIREIEILDEKASELTKELLASKADVKTETGVMEIVKIEAKETVNSEEIITEQAADMKCDVAKTQAIESCETREEGRGVVESKEIIREVEMPHEKASELKEELLVPKADVKSESTETNIVKLEAKETVNSEEIITEQAVDMKCDVAKTQAIESCETREEGQGIVESKEIIREVEMPDDKASELKEELLTPKADVKSETTETEIVNLEAKETMSSEEVITEQAVDMKGDVGKAQAIESCETREEGRGIVESKEVIREVEMPDGKASELKEELQASKADIKTATGVTEIVNQEAKETVSSDEVITEQAVDMKCEIAKVQAIESCETREEGQVKVESKEIIREVAIPDEKSSELKEKILTPKADVKSETGEPEIVKIEAKETVSSEEVITEQAVDMKGHVGKAEAIESCETREEGRGIVESKEVIREVVMPDDKASELKEELLASKADIKTATGVTEIVKVEAKQVIHSEKVVPEPNLDNTGDVAESLAIESLESKGIVEVKNISKQKDKKIVKDTHKNSVYEDLFTTEITSGMKDILAASTDKSFDIKKETSAGLDDKESITEDGVPVQETCESKDELLETEKVLPKGTVASQKVFNEQHKLAETVEKIEELIGQVTASEVDSQEAVNRPELDDFKSEISEVIKGADKIDLTTEIKDKKPTDIDFKVDKLAESEYVQETFEAEMIENAEISNKKLAVSEAVTPILFEEIAVSEEDKLTPVTVGETIEAPLAKVAIEHGHIIQHIEDFIANDIVEIIDEISSLMHAEDLKETVVVAKEFRNFIITSDSQALEEAVPLNDMMVQQAKLAEKLQDSLSLLHTKALESSQELVPVVKSENLQKISEIITHLQDDLENVIVSAPIVVKEEKIHLFKEREEDSLKRLDSLLKEVDTIIDSTDKNDTDNLKDTLDEVQTVIIKLKKDFDGAGDILNETLDDLECSVRSVQLQINEDSPQDLLREACATLKLLVNNMSETKNLKPTEEIHKESNARILENCSTETDRTLKLLDEAAKIKVSDLGNLKNVISCLISLKDTMKSLRESFNVDAEMLIEKGVEVTQCLHLLEDKVFSIERDVEREATLKIDVKDRIITAINSVYSSISNMRSTISSIQKRYMFENYGKPSEILLQSIKNIKSIANADNDKKATWKRLSKSLRGVLNHFEDIKFYINLDKTARLPSDAAFTKIILKELKCSICEVIPHSIVEHSEVSKKVQITLRCLEQYLQSIETHSTVEVKTKIPIFKEIASHIFSITNSIKTILEWEDMQKVLLDEEKNINMLPQTATQSDSEINITSKIFGQENTEEMLAIKQKNDQDEIVADTKASLRSLSHLTKEVDAKDSKKVTDTENVETLKVTDDHYETSTNDVMFECVTEMGREILPKINSTHENDMTIVDITVEVDKGSKTQKDKQLETDKTKDKTPELDIHVELPKLISPDIEKPSTSQQKEDILDKTTKMKTIDNQHQDLQDVLKKKFTTEESNVSEQILSEKKESTNNAEIAAMKKQNAELKTEQVLGVENQTKVPNKLVQEPDFRTELQLVNRDTKSEIEIEYNEHDKHLLKVEEDTTIKMLTEGKQRQKEETEGKNIAIEEKQTKVRENTINKDDNTSKKVETGENIKQGEKVEAGGHKDEITKTKIADKNLKLEDSEAQTIEKEKKFDKKKVEDDQKRQEEKEPTIKLEQEETEDNLKNKRSKECKKYLSDEREVKEGEKLAHEKKKIKEEESKMEGKNEETERNKSEEDKLQQEYNERIKIDNEKQKQEIEAKINQEKEEAQPNIMEKDIEKVKVKMQKQETNEIKKLTELKLIQEEEITIKKVKEDDETNKIKHERLKQEEEAKIKKEKEAADIEKLEYKKLKQDDEIKKKIEKDDTEDMKIQVKGKESKSQKVKEEEDRKEFEEKKLQQEKEVKLGKEKEETKKKKLAKDKKKQDEAEKKTLTEVKLELEEQSKIEKKKEKAEANKLEEIKEKIEMEKAVEAEKKKLEHEKLKQQEEAKLKKEKDETEALKLQEEEKKVKDTKAQMVKEEEEEKKLEEERLGQEAEAKTGKRKENIKKKKLAEAKIEQEEKAKLKKEQEEAEIKKLEEEKKNLVLEEAEKTKWEDEKLKQEEEAKIKQQKEEIEALNLQNEEKNLKDKETKAQMMKEEEEKKKIEREKLRLEKEAIIGKKEETEKKKLSKDKKKQEEAEKKKLTVVKIEEEENAKIKKEQEEAEVKKLETEKKELESEEAEKTKLEREKLKQEEEAKIKKEKEETEALKLQEEEKKKLEEENLRLEKEAKIKKEKEETEALKLQEDEKKKLDEEKLRLEEEANIDKNKEETKKKKLSKDKKKQEEAEKKKLAELKIEKEEKAKIKKEQDEAEVKKLETEKKKLESEEAEKTKLEHESLKQEKEAKINKEKEETEALKLQEEEKRVKEKDAKAQMVKKEEEKNKLEEEKLQLEEEAKIGNVKKETEKKKLSKDKKKQEEVEKKKLAEVKIEQEKEANIKKEQEANIKKEQEAEAQKLEEEKKKLESEDTEKKCLSKDKKKQEEAEKKKLAEVKIEEEEKAKIKKEQGEAEAKKLEEGKKKLESEETEKKKLSKNKKKQGEAEKKKLAEVEIKQEDEVKIKKEKEDAEAKKLEEQKKNLEVEEAADAEIKKLEREKLTQEEKARIMNDKEEEINEKLKEEESKKRKDKEETEKNLLEEKKQQQEKVKVSVDKKENEGAKINKLVKDKKKQEEDEKKKLEDEVHKQKELKIKTDKKDAETKKLEEVKEKIKVEEAKGQSDSKEKERKKLEEEKLHQKQDRTNEENEKAQKKRLPKGKKNQEDVNKMKLEDEKLKQEAKDGLKNNKKEKEPLKMKTMEKEEQITTLTKDVNNQMEEEHKQKIQKEISKETEYKEHKEETYIKKNSEKCVNAKNEFSLLEEDTINQNIYEENLTEKAKYRISKVGNKQFDREMQRTVKIETEIEEASSSNENGELCRKGDNSERSQRYIKEYQYEPHKKEQKDKPQFIDHNHKDYSMDFDRPSGYREKSFDNRVENYETLGLGKNATIYKAKTIVLESQLRTSTSPYSAREEIKKEREESRSESRRSNAMSEARSMTSEKRSVVRDLKRKPVFSTYLTERTAVEGSRVKLTCSVLCSTDPTITWYKNGIILDNKLKYRTKYIDGLITLEVLNAVPSDSAEYSCTVENENGSVSSSANLKVYPSFEASPIPPTFTRSIRDTYHLAENELVLECRIRGQPLPTITWFKDDQLITPNERYQAYYLADGVCRLAIDRPTPEDSGKYTCKAENSVWSDHISHVVNFTGKESRLSPNLTTIERSRFNRQVMESRRPHFTNVLTDYKVVKGGTIGLQVEIRGSPTHVEWLREGRAVTEIYRNARTFVEQGLYTLALSDVTEKESGLYTCRAWSNQGNVDMNAAITVVSPNDLDGRPATIVGRPEKDILISIGEDVNISFRVQGEPKPKVVFMKGIRDITTSQRVCKMTSDDYVKFTLKRSTISDAGTYCILARNAYGCDRAFVTVVVRQRATSENLISDWTYPMDDTALSIAERKFKSVPDRIPGEPSVVDGGSNWVSIAWPKPDPGSPAPVLAYKVESWLIGKEGGARWMELGITPLNSFDAFNLKQGEEYHFRVTPRNRYGFGESVQTSTPIGVGLAGDRPEFVDILPGQLKVLVGETANLACSVKGRPVPEVTWMKNGHEIEEDKRMNASFNGFNCCLTIDNIDIDDEGRYSCEASNVHGRASTYARLAVVTDRLIWEADAKLKRERSADAEGEYPPQFTMRLRDRRVQATYPVRLTCQVVGNPSPTVTWLKDAEEVTLDSRHNKYQDEHFHTLEIAPTTLDDAGVYEAMARNSCGAVSCRCGLVVDKGIRAYVAPEFCCGLEPLYRLNEGEELRISAVVEAYPSVGVTWYRNGVRLRPSRRAVMTLDRDGQIELALASITNRDAGVYTCTASNEVGRASTSGKVEVLGGETTAKRTPPVIISPDVPYSKEPMFIRKPRSSEAREGDTVIIACEVVGDPKPDVYWLRDFLKPDYYRDSSHFKRVGDGPEYRFEIPHAKLDYTGAYSVVARNVHGETKAIISLQIKARDPTCSEDVHNIRYGRVEVIPRFDRNLTDLLSYDGDTVEFECRVSGNPEPDIRWFHYTELIRECPDFESTYEEGAARLKIKQVTADDEGTYTCEASNNLGKATSSACLVVYPPGEPNTLSQRLRRPPALLSAASTPRSTPRSTPARSVSRTPGPESRRVSSPSRSVAPTFYTYPFNKVVEEGDHVLFQCAVKGLPSPWATWDKDGVIITPTSRITIREKDDILRILEIEQVSIEDVGVYRITVENEFGRAEASARLEVITRSGKFYAGVRAYSASPRKSFPYKLKPSTSRD